MFFVCVCFFNLKIKNISFVEQFKLLNDRPILLKTLSIIPYKVIVGFCQVLTFFYRILLRTGPPQHALQTTHDVHFPNISDPCYQIRYTCYSSEPLMLCPVSNLTNLVGCCHVCVCYVIPITLFEMYLPLASLLI